jgi:hypothetical protein
MTQEDYLLRTAYDRAIRRACTIDDFCQRDAVAAVIAYAFSTPVDNVLDDLDVAYVKGTKRLVEFIFGRRPNQPAPKRPTIMEEEGR